MTSTVKVAAHCTQDKEVVITIKTLNSPDEEIILEAGDTREVVVFPERSVSVTERVKAVPAAE